MGLPLAHNFIRTSSIPNIPSPLIWRITDGKAGHENQSLALVRNLQALAPFRVLDLPASMRGLRKVSERPSLVVGTGHRTHLALLAAARRFEAPSVVIMKPTIPSAFFDLLLVPEHDLSNSTANNIIATKGMLNLIPVDRPPKEERGLILVGGPSKHHGIDQDSLLSAITSIISHRPHLDWHLTDSRRTPEDFSARLDKLNLVYHPSSQSPREWLPQELLRAREVWVTEDSMSMIYEAITARACVGLLPMPRKTPRSRVVRGIDRLIESEWTRFFSARADHDLPKPPELHEASRCAREVLHRFFPSLT